MPFVSLLDTGPRWHDGQPVERTRESVDVRGQPTLMCIMIMLKFSLYITHKEMPCRDEVTQEINKMNSVEVLKCKRCTEERTHWFERHSFVVVMKWHRSIRTGTLPHAYTIDVFKLPKSNLLKTHRKKRRETWVTSLTAKFRKNFN